MRFYKIDDLANEPIRATPGSAGLDLCSIEEGLIPKGNRKAFRTGLIVELPDDTYGRIAPRSGLSLKHNIDVAAGVIDNDYRGEIKIILCNFSKKDYLVKTGDKIAQLIVESIKILKPTMISGFNEISTTERNDNGFGSSDK